LDTKVEGDGVSVCPGPNMAYYSKVMSLQNITDHIYGRDNMLSRKDRPNMFIKELHIYMDYLKNKFDETKRSLGRKEEKYLKTSMSNMNIGITYYQSLFKEVEHSFQDVKTSVLNELKICKSSLDVMQTEFRALVAKV
jgi:hypothetical protein